MPTLKEQLKQSLRENDPAYRYYKSIFNLISDLIALSDGDHIVDANERFASFFRILGYDVFAPEFRLSDHFETIDKYGYVYEGYQGKRWVEAVLSGEKEHYRVGIAGVEKLYTFNVALAALEPVDGVYVVTLTDVTEMMGYKHILEEGIRSSVEDKEEAEMLLEQYDYAMNVSNLVSRSNLDGNFTYVNDSFCDTLGYRRDELIGENVLVLCPADENDLFYESIWKMIDAGNIWHGVLRNVDKAENIHYFDTTVVPIRDRAGEIIEYLSIRHEITATVKAQTEAIHNLESKTKFFDQISHELRTPLNAIVNFTDQALENFDEMFEDETARELVQKYLERAHKNSENLLLLINSLLDMAKFKSGKETFAMNPCEVVSLAREVYENCSSLSDRIKINYGFKSSVSSVWIHSDPVKLRQILTNLISNAFKFTPAGFIDIRIGEHQDECFIEVEDSGVGIPADKLSFIFEPFEQVRKHDPGTGLGLSIVKEYAQAMGLTLEVISIEGQGSRFTLKTKKIPAKGEEWTI